MQTLDVDPEEAGVLLGCAVLGPGHAAGPDGGEARGGGGGRAAGPRGGGSRGRGGGLGGGPGLGDCLHGLAEEGVGLLLLPAPRAVPSSPRNRATSTSPRPASYAASTAATTIEPSTRGEMAWSGKYF